MSTFACPLLAELTFGQWLPAAGAKSGEHDAPGWLDRLRLSESVPSWAASWRWPNQPARDSASLAAFGAWRDGEVSMFLRQDAVEWPSQIPLLIHHLELPVGVFNTHPGSIEVVGEKVWLKGWADPRSLATLRDLPYLSMGLMHERIRFAEHDGRRYADVEAASIVELSATATPLLSGARLTVGAVQPVPDGESHELTPDAERFQWSV